MFSDRYKEYIQILQNQPYITIISNTNVLIEGCKQIMDCSDILVRIMTKKYTVEIWGYELKISNYSSESIEVNGKINTINLNLR